MVKQREEKVIALSGLDKVNAPEEDACSFKHDLTTRRKRDNTEESSLSPNRKSNWKGGTQEGTSPSREQDTRLVSTSRKVNKGSTYAFIPSERDMEVDDERTNIRTLSVSISKCVSRYVNVRKPDVASDSDSDWDALLDAHILAPPPNVAAAAVAQPADPAGAGRRARDKRRRRLRKAAKRSMWRDIQTPSEKGGLRTLSVSISKCVSRYVNVRKDPFLVCRQQLTVSLSRYDERETCEEVPNLQARRV